MTISIEQAVGQLQKLAADRPTWAQEGWASEVEYLSHINCELRQELSARREAIRRLLLDNTSDENRKFARWACGEKP